MPCRAVRPSAPTGKPRETRYPPALMSCWCAASRFRMPKPDSQKMQRRASEGWTTWSRAKAGVAIRRMYDTGVDGNRRLAAYRTAARIDDRSEKPAGPFGNRTFALAERYY
jgi:hypothetical protein